jgi:Tfp pilus assembly protein PilO
MKETKNILSLFFASILIFFFIFLPKFEVFLREKRTLDNKKEELFIQEQYFKKLNDLESELAFYDPKLKLMDLMISEESIVPSFVYYLNNTSQNNGLFFQEIGSVSKNISKINPEINEIDISFSLSGSYNDFKNFINNLEKSIKIVKINDISISSVPEEEQGETFNPDTLVYNVSITIYYY